MAQDCVHGCDDEHVCEPVSWPDDEAVLDGINARAERKYCALAMIGLVLWFAALAWTRPLMQPDEGRYVGIAWEMVRSGDWLTPTLNGLPYFHKPPLFYWITAASMELFGPNAWAARAASFIGAAIGGVAIWRFVARWYGEREAQRTLAVLIVFPLFYLGGQFANLDMLVGGLITATIVLLADAAFSIDGRAPYEAALSGAWACAALAILAKGLIGVVLPVLVIGVWLIAGGRWRTLRGLLWWPSLLLFVVIVSPWFLAMQWLHPGFLHYFVVVQQIERYASGGFNNLQPFWFYPAVLAVAALPWAFALIRHRANPITQDPLGDEIRRLMVIWVGAVVLFFSVPDSKLLGYVLPAVPPLAFLLANAWPLPAGSPAASHGSPASLAASPDTPPNPASNRVWVASLVMALLVDFAVVGWFSINTARSNREVALQLKQRRAADQPVFMLGHYYFDVPFYAALDAPVQIVDDWSVANVARSDNWRREVGEAGGFAPALAAARLVAPDALAQRLCHDGTSWLIGDASALRQYRFVGLATEVTDPEASARLWKLDGGNPDVAHALGCNATLQALH